VLSDLKDRLQAQDQSLKQLVYQIKEMDKEVGWFVLTQGRQ